MKTERFVAVLLAAGMAVLAGFIVPADLYLNHRIDRLERTILPGRVEVWQIWDPRVTDKGVTNTSWATLEAPPHTRATNEADPGDVTLTVRPGEIFWKVDPSGNVTNHLRASEFAPPRFLDQALAELGTNDFWMTNLPNGGLIIIRITNTITVDPMRPPPGWVLPPVLPLNSPVRYYRRQE